MSKSSKTKILIIAILLILAICLYFISGTYAKYASTATANSTTEVAKWIVKLGTVDITKTNDFTSELTLVPDAQEYVAEGKIAPATTATGSFTIDPTGAEVAMKYSITIGELSYSGTQTPNFKIKSVKTSNREVTVDGAGAYSGIIELSDVTAGTKIPVEIQVEWESTNNESDTAVGIEAGTLTVPVTVAVEQYTGA